MNAVFSEELLFRLLLPLLIAIAIDNALAAFLAAARECGWPIPPRIVASKSQGAFSENAVEAVLHQD